MFNYDQQAGMSAGAGKGISESGAYIGIITASKFIEASSGSKGIEMSFESDSGQETKFLTLYYAKKSGERLDIGYNMVNSILGVTGVKALQSGEELIGRKVGLGLQKAPYFNNKGEERYSFEIKFAFSPRSRKTLAEHINDEPAKYVDNFVFQVKEAQPLSPVVQGYASTPPPTDEFDRDDIPF